MIKGLFIITLTLTVLSISSATTLANNYHSGDQLYVWAKNGLNVRSGPGTEFDILDGLIFGEHITVIEKTKKSFNVLGIPGRKATQYYAVTDPVILYGRWVKIRTTDSVEGYVIDQYLLDIQPDTSKKKYLEPNLFISSVDTLYKNTEFTDGSGRNLAILYTYVGGITRLESSGGVWGSEKYIIPNYSIEESLILLSPLFNDYHNYSVTLNWKNELRFTDNELCGFTITVKDGKTYFEWMCSC